MGVPGAVERALSRIRFLRRFARIFASPPRRPRCPGVERAHRAIPHPDAGCRIRARAPPPARTLGAAGRRAGGGAHTGRHAYSFSTGSLRAVFIAHWLWGFGLRRMQRYRRPAARPSPRLFDEGTHSMRRDTTLDCVRTQFTVMCVMRNVWSADQRLPHFYTPLIGASWCSKRGGTASAWQSPFSIGRIDRQGVLRAGARIACNSSEVRSPIDLRSISDAGPKEASSWGRGCSDR